MITQLQSDQPHLLTHKFTALRVSSVAMTAASSRLVSDDNSDDDDDEDEDSQVGDENGGDADETGGGGASTSNNSKFIKQYSDMVYDKDYLPDSFAQNDYNYLDPNFLPH